MRPKAAAVPSNDSMMPLTKLRSLRYLGGQVLRHLATKHVVCVEHPKVENSEGLSSEKMASRRQL